ncbi:MAG: hypothetical protein OHK0036_17160 [Bacteroidia bacterium]
MKKQVLTIGVAALAALGAMKGQCTFTITGINITPGTGTNNYYFTPQVMGNISPGNTYAYWDFGDGHYDASPAISSTSFSAGVNTYCSAGTYTISVAVVDSTSSPACPFQTAQATITITSNLFDVTGINIGNSDPSFNFTAMVNNPNGISLSYQWDLSYPNNLSATGNPVSHTYSSNGNYVINVDVSGNGCVKSSTTAISVSNATFCFSTPSLIVNNNDPTFNFTLNANPMPSASSIYYWNFGDGTNIVTTSNTSSHTYTANGTYWVCAWVYDSTGVCTYTSACQNIVVNNAALLPLSCNPVSFTAWADSANPQIWYYNYTPIQPSGGNSPYTITAYFWDFGDGNSSTAAFPSYTYATPGTYTVCIHITWKDANNDSCISTNCVQINRLMAGSSDNNINVLGNAKYIYPHITGINNLSASPKVKLYPNPAHESIKLEMNASVNGQIRIFDVTGRMIYTQSIENTTEANININQLDKGLYIIKLTDNNHNELFKQTFIKE